MPSNLATPQQSFFRFKDWFVEKALPLWTKQSYDHASGGFYEALNFDGTPTTGLARRVRVQTRQIYTFTEAGIRGWHDGAEALAAKGFDFFLTTACPDEGVRGCAHLLSEGGKIIDDRRDLYDQAFLLLACASRWKAAKDDRALALADKVATFVDRELASSYGGWAEDDRGTLPRRQNPHMHLFEAFTTLYEATGQKHWLDNAAKVLDLMRSIFFDPGRGVVREFFDSEMKFLTDRSAVEPGHMFEWVWLLRNYQRHSQVDLAAIRRTLFSRGAELGEDPDFFGFIGNEISISAQPERTEKRLWPQTEYIKACLAQAGDGNAKAHSRAAQLINDLFKTYLDTPTPGLWIDEYDKTGAAIAPHVPASILYHMFEAVTETVDSIKAGDAS